MKLMPNVAVGWLVWLLMRIHRDTITTRQDVSWQVLVIAPLRQGPKICPRTNHSACDSPYNAGCLG